MASLVAAPAFARQDAGQIAYAKAGCESCHGPDAKGDGQGQALVPLVHDLPELVAIVRQGMGLMPGTSRDVATDAEIDAIYKYLKSLSDAPASETAPPRAASLGIADVTARLDRASLAGDLAVLAATREELQRVASGIGDAAAQRTAHVAAAYATWEQVVQSPAPPPESDVLVTQAIEHIQRAIQMNERPADAHAFLAALSGLQLSMSGAPTPAIAERIAGALERAKSLDPDGARVLFLSGVTAVLAPDVAGGLDSAEQRLRRAEGLLASHGPGQAWPRWSAATAAAWLGRALLKRGDPHGARQAYERALKLQPDYAWVKQVLMPRVPR